MLKNLKEDIYQKNIADLLTEAELEEIGEDVIDNYEEDCANYVDQEKAWDAILGLAKQVQEEKNWPWPNASNIKYPLIAHACIKFAASVYPEIVQPGGVAKVKKHGRDPDGGKQQRAGRVERHLNYQFSEKIESWESDMDVLLSRLPMYGAYFKKVYYSQIDDKPVVDIIKPGDIVTSCLSSSLETEQRITQRNIIISHNGIVERIRDGQFLNLDIDRDEEDDPDDNEFLEQHCYLDLDEDGYEEPYIVTVHKDSKQVFRIAARFTEDDIKEKKNGDKKQIVRIVPFTHYVKYYIFPAFEDGEYLGLGHLLLPLNEAINSLINQLIDAGTLDNLQTGFMAKGVRSDGGPVRLSMGEFIPIETRGNSLKDDIVPLPFTGPSETLFALLGVLTEVAKELAAAKDISPDTIPGNTPALSVMAMIGEGMKVYSSIHKRIYNSIKLEVKKIARLNSLYGNPEEYADFHDEDNVNLFNDYSEDDVDISPMASPQISSDMQRLMQAQSMVAMLDSQGAMASGLNPRAVMMNYLQAIKHPDIENTLPEPPPPSDEPPLEQQMMEIQAELEEARIMIQQQEANRKDFEAEAKAAKDEAAAIKSLADAEAAEAGTQLEFYKQQVEELKARNEEAKQRRVSGVEGSPDNAVGDEGAGRGS